MLRQHCCAKPGVVEDYPFGEETATFRVMGKMFALSDPFEFTLINVKCDPELALELRAQYSAVTPGYHMNKKHWNSLLKGILLEIMFIRKYYSLLPE